MGVGDRSATIRAVLLSSMLIGSMTGCGDDPGQPQDADDGCCGSDDRFADVVVDGLDIDPADTLLAINGVRGGGGFQGGTDVLRLGYEPGVDHAVTLRWSDRRVDNGPGVDFVIFENAFEVAGGAGRFMDPLIVEVSRDGQIWVPMPHDYVAADESTYSDDPDDWPGFAGVEPVYYHHDDNPVDPFDEAAAGGDQFDLADLRDGDGEARAISEAGFSFLRIVTAPSQLNPDTGAPYVRAPVSDGGDIDGVAARYLATERDDR